MNKQIKIKSAAIITSIAFLGMIVFGTIFVMDMNMDMDQHTASECPFALFGGGTCLQNALGATMHHISVYQSFSHVLVSKNIAGLLILIILSSILWLFGRRLFFNQELSLAYLTKHHIKNRYSSLKSEDLATWLSLFENSPSHPTTA